MKIVPKHPDNVRQTIIDIEQHRHMFDMDRFGNLTPAALAPDNPNCGLMGCIGGFVMARWPHPERSFVQNVAVVFGIEYAEAADLCYAHVPFFEPGTSCRSVTPEKAIEVLTRLANGEVEEVI